MIKTLIGKKIGMTRIFEDKTGEVIPVTVISILPSKIVRLRNVEKDGYSSICVGYEETKKLNNPEKTYFEKNNLPLFKNIIEFRTTENGEYKIGGELDFNSFSVNDYVDVIGMSKGKGFSGVMKRHNFGGLDSGHGHTEYRRASGSIGASSAPSRVFPNTKMAGRMGHKKNTVKKLLLVKTDPENKLLFVKGSVPGVNKGYLIVNETKSAIKKKIIVQIASKKSKRVK